MTWETLTALISFALVSSITPGPNNIMLMASGTNFGFKKSIPHMLGVSIGFALMVVLVGVGLMQIFELYPWSQKILQVICVSYLLYLAYKIATSTSAVGDGSKKAKPFSFIQAVLFQWVNPKAWTMALSAISLFSKSKDFYEMLQIGVAFGLVNLPSVCTWVIMGQQLKRFLENPKALKVFNYVMAALLVGSFSSVIGASL